MTRLSTHIVLSTAHLTQEVSDALQEKGADSETTPRNGTWTDGVVVCEFAYGHWVRIPRQIDDDEESVAAFRERMEGIPESLRHCMEHARRFGASWILFDREEEEIDDLTTYDW